MAKKPLYNLLFALVSLSACNGSAQSLVLADHNTSIYKIVVPADATKLEQRSANVLQKYIRQVSGAELPIAIEGRPLATPAIYIGHTAKAEKVHPGKMKQESYLLRTDGKDLVILGGSGKGLIYGVYNFLETYIGCKKLADELLSRFAQRPLRQRGPGRLLIIRIERARRALGAGFETG